MAEVFPDGSFRDGSSDVVVHNAASGDGDTADAAIGADLADLITDAARRIRIDASHELAAHGVTWAQVRALRACSRSPEPMRMSDLAGRLGIARRSATSVVDELEARGLVARGDDPGDRRATTVSVTSAGDALLAEVRLLRRVAADRLTAAADLTTADVATLARLLGRLAHPPTAERASEPGRDQRTSRSARTRSRRR